MIGRTLSHFKILAQLGAGGMGEVYRAEDTNLGREVAVKVLPEAFTADPERLARFEREAKLLAALSHPAIAAIHEVGAADGVHFLVMELAPGETLAERIDRGALPPAEALPLALQIAEALEAAHKKGIVHRDLKPPNVKVAPDGSVKVLDFGLAKALDPDAGPATGALMSQSPTLTAQVSQAGMLLGTAAYMSPEQAAGQGADARADIWAFGVVLLEMLTGRRTFAGETVTQVLASVLRDEPEVHRLPAGCPPALSELLHRCLRKEPQRRLQSIGDARVELEDLIAGRELPGRSTAGLGGSERTRPTARAALPWVLAAVLGALVVGLGWREFGSSPGAAGRLMRFSIALPPAVRLALDGEDDILAISSDGERQVFVGVSSDDATRHLYLRELTQAEGRELPGTTDAGSPFFSPDGEWVGYFDSGKLLKVPVAGGPPVTIAALPTQDRGATWSRDGFIYLAADTAGGLQRVSENGGDLEEVTVLDVARGERTHRWPQALPDGKVVLFTSDTAASTEFYDDARIEAVEVATGRRTVLVEHSSRAQYLTEGYLIYARGGVLYAVRFDSDTLAVGTRQAVVLQGVATTVVSGAAHFAVAENGSIVYVAGDLSMGESQPRWVDSDGEATPLLADLGGVIQLALAPDERRVAVLRSVGEAPEIWVADLERGTMSRLTFDGGASSPVWTPDGRSVIYGWSGVSDGGEPGGIFRTPADGSGAPEALWRGETALVPMAVSPDGTLLAVDRFESARQSDIWILPLDGETAPYPFLATPGDEYMARFSPNGRWLAYVSLESGRPQIYVRPFPGPGGKWQISVDVGFEPRWSNDGQSLWFRAQGKLLRVPIDSGAGSFAAGRPEPLFDGLPTSASPFTYSVAADGEHVLYLPTGGETTADGVHLVLGWGDEVRRLMAPRR